MLTDWDSVVPKPWQAAGPITLASDKQPCPALTNGLSTGGSACEQFLRSLCRTVGENVLIRTPQPADKQAWWALWSGYISFYGASVPEAVTEVLWQRIVSNADAVFARLAVDAEGLAGFAVCVLHPFTWGTQPVCLLEDLYVDPARRGVGVGRRLLDSLREEAAREGWARLYWHTRYDNATARRLYDSYVSADGFVRYTIAFDGTIATAAGRSISTTGPRTAPSTC